jgi:hypothetical protein
MGWEGAQHQPNPNAKRCDRTHTRLQNAVVAQIVLPLSRLTTGGSQRKADLCDAGAGTSRC